MAKQQLIDDVQARARQFKDLVATCPEDEFEAKRIDGRWGYRELMAHLTGWQGQLAAGFRQASESPRAESNASAAADLAWNDVFAEHAKGKQREQILREYDDGVAAFVSSASAAPEDMFEEGHLGYRLAQDDLARFQQHIDMVRNGAN